MRRSRTTKLYVTVLTSLASLGVAAPAQANWTDNVRYYREFSICSDTGEGLDIGAGMYIQELGKHRVISLRTKYLLYDTDPNSAGIHQSVGRMTKQSTSFPDDDRSFRFNASHGNKHTFHVGYGEWWVVAKLTWDRKHRRDWNTKVAAAHCAVATP